MGQAVRHRRVEQDRHQSVAWATPSRSSNPAGVCIHEFRTIQKADKVVPNATRTVANVCVQLGTRLIPNSMMPRNTASRKNAVRIS